MKYSGLYFIPNSSNSLDASLTTVSSLVQGIENNFQNALRQNPWQLQYRVFRDTLPTGYQPPNDAEGKAQPFPHTYQHHLTLTSLSSTRTYLCTQPPGVVAAIPVKQREMYAALIRHQSAALWTPRHVLAVQSGVSYNIGLCTIQIGELHSIREGPQSNVTHSPGVLVCISTPVGNDSDEDDTVAAAHDSMENGTAQDVNGDAAAVDFGFAEAIIRDCWDKIKEGKDLGRSEVRDVMMAKEYVTGHREKDAVVRMWCNILRLRG